MLVEFQATPSSGSLTLISGPDFHNQKRAPLKVEQTPQEPQKCHLPCQYRKNLSNFFSPKNAPRWFGRFPCIILRIRALKTGAQPSKGVELRSVPLFDILGRKLSVPKVTTYSCATPLNSDGVEDTFGDIVICYMHA